ncbi:VCBS repeat-containing protein [Kocuria flava]|uniref:FG-GAP repeat domain-containing protein n=1 Tax=Kocuria flava TaxID=446860 RepID=UPI001FF47BE6|nr:VCBS repeat-containing protein [Kocuria flava]MCJ8504546.1 VCBS repeat-containing protein [Kocuria flava]
MSRSMLTRLLTGASAALLAATGIAVAGPAQAATAQPFLSYRDGWRVERHPRALGDLNGDGRADVVGFGDAGVWVGYGRADGTFAAPALAVRDFGWNQGWRVDRHPRHVADVDGDGRDDLVGFGDAGVVVSYAQPGGGFTAPQLKLREFGRNQGWRTDQHVRALADLSGNGTADIVGFGYSGVTVSHGRTDRTFDGTGKRIDSYGWDRGWRVEKNPRLLADVDGNGTADIVGFGDAGTYVSYFSVLGDTFTQPALEVRDFGWSQGWRVDQHPRAVADANGDGRADLIGFGRAGTYAAYSRAHLAGEPTFFPVSLELSDLGTAQGWRVDRHPRGTADVNGDGIADVVGFGNAGTYAAFGDDNFLVGPQLLTPEFGYGAGWTPDRYPRLLGDVNGDGRDDVVGFGFSATYVGLL